MNKNLILLLLLLFLGTQNAAAQAGSLDLSFNGTGIIETKIEGNSAWFQRVRLQPDGKILSFALVNDWTALNGSVSRYLPDGSLDQSFGDHGIYITPDTFPYHVGIDGLLLPDGKIMLICDIAYQNAYGLVRLLPSGVPDSTYGINGFSFIDFDFNYYNPIPHTALLQADGKIVLLGDYEHDLSTGILHGLVVRIMPDGTLDPSFGTAGIQIISSPTPNLKLGVFGGKIQPDGKILMSGYLGNDVSNRSWYIARLMPDGSFDTSFSGDGIITPNLGNSFFEASYALHLLEDGSFIAAGHAQKTPGSHFTMLKYLPNGSSDGSFGLGGKAQVDFGCCHSIIFDIAEQADHKIVVAGLSDSDNDHTFCSVARVKPNGFLDQEFGAQGRIKFEFHHDSVRSSATSLAIQPDGKILVAGYTEYDSIFFSTSCLMLRLNPAANVGVHSPESLSDLGLKIAPNPVISNTLQVSFQLPSSTEVSLSLMDLMGRKTHHLILAETRSSGISEAQFEWPNALPAGQYFLKLETPEGSQWAKIIKI